MKGRKRLPPFPEGTRFGKWTVLHLIGYDKLGSLYKCICECGNEKDIRGDILRQLRTSSCLKCAINKRKSLIKL